MKQPVILATALVAAIAAPLSAQTKRAFSYDDFAKIHAVSDPQRSPDGKWVAYTVSTTDVEKDKHNRDVWMVSWDGKEQVQLTSSPGQRVHAALEPGRQVPRVSRRRAATKTTRRRARRCGSSTAPAARRCKLTESRAASTTTRGRPTASGSCSS